jgi:hypothetical protein
MRQVAATKDSIPLGKNNNMIRFPDSPQILSATIKSGHPKLISNGIAIFLSRTTKDHGHHFIEI